MGVAFAATPQLRQLAMVYIPGNPGFQSVAFYKGNLIISHSAAGTVDVFSSPKRRILAQIKLERPSGLVVDENDGVVYVADADAKNIAVISARNWKLQKTIPVKVQPGPLALSPDGEKLFVGNDYDGSISVVNVASGQVSTQGIDGHPDSIVYDPGRNQVFVTLEDQSQIVVLDPALRVLRRYTLSASQPTGLALDAQARRLYVAVRYAVVALNADDGAEMSRVPAATGVDSLALDRDGRRLYAASGNEIDVIRVTPSVLVAEDKFLLKIHGHGVVFDPDKKQVLMPGAREGRSLVLILRPTQYPPLTPASTEAMIK